MKLIRIARSDDFPVFMEGLRSEPRGLQLENHDDENYRRRGEFFVFHDERDVPNAVQQFANENPGKEIQVWELKTISQCPAAPMVTKQVTADGILPE